MRIKLHEAGAAEALGLSRRQVAYYASGEHEVPRTVLLACKGWEVERQAAARQTPKREMHCNLKKRCDSSIGPPVEAGY